GGSTRGTGSAWGGRSPGSASPPRHRPAGSHHRGMSASPRLAAVLVPVFRDVGGRLRIVLIVRTDHGLHGGQLAVPGGKHDAGDESLLATALREAREEIGVEQVDVLAELPTVRSGPTN